MVNPNTGIPHSDYVVKLGVHAYTSKPSCSLKILQRCCIVYIWFPRHSMPLSLL